jgi:hypothetical protein
MSREVGHWSSDNWLGCLPHAGRRREDQSEPRDSLDNIKARPTSLVGLQLPTRGLNFILRHIYFPFTLVGNKPSPKNSGLYSQSICVRELLDSISSFSVIADLRRVGHDHSAMMYMVLGASTLNVVLSHPDDIDISQWNSEMMSKEIKRQFEGWDPW